MSAPLYLQIKHYIADKIDTGQWPAGHKITTELALTRQFNVSRMTANKAIRDLVSEGKLHRKPRLGTFVCAPEIKAESSLTGIRNIADEVRQRGKQYKNIVVQQKAVNADEISVIRWDVKQGCRTFYSEIIHYADDSPIQLEVRWVNAEYVPDYLSQDFSCMTPNQYLSENNPLSAIEHTVEAIVPEETVRLALGMPEHEPCLLLKRRTWSGGHLISSALLYHPGSKYTLSANIKLN